MKSQMLLGEIALQTPLFPHLDKVLKPFRSREFGSLPESRRSERVNRALLEWIQAQEEPCFLLPAVLQYVEKVEEEKILEHYRFNNFEFWLNQLSRLSFEENYRIRGKIAGKYVERSDYQLFFPIGMGKVYEGSHFVTAHKSPDLDTTVASFWGWLDAFAARVSEGLHLWNVPGGPPASQIEIDLVFRSLFGPGVFTHLAKNRTALSLTCTDLMTQKGIVIKKPEDSIAVIEHERENTSVVVVDEEGYYVGDWRNTDVEQVRQVILLLSSCLRWFENNLHLNLISSFAKEHLSLQVLEPLLRDLFGMLVAECEPAVEFSPKLKAHVEDFLREVLKIPKGLDSTFEEFGIRLAHFGGVPFDGVERIIASMKRAKLFDDRGTLIEDRPRIFTYLEKAISSLHEGIMKIRSRLERLDVALMIKSDVFGHKQNFVSVRSDVDEIRAKMGSFSSLTVNYPDGKKLYPAGVIQASDVRKPTLGTVSLRDFCNREEMTIPSYLEVISVIDHHKSNLATLAPPFVLIADTQSSNSLIANQSFQINDRYSLLGQDPSTFRKQLADCEGKKTASSSRISQRLLKRQQAAESKSGHFIHPEREYIEYLHFLYAILDDTDLLTKVSSFDVECVASLLNRMKTLALKKESEVVSLDDLPRDKNFAKQAAQRLLQCEDLYSLYRRVYEYREKEVERNMELAADGKPSNLFSDTKEQNGCCRVGQTKLFASNLNYFHKKADSIRNVWLKSAKDVQRENPDVDLHIHMISTVVSADEVYRGAQGTYAHKDELWIWIPPEETAMEHLKSFLNAFQASPGLKNNAMEVEFLGNNAAQLASAFEESFRPIPQQVSNQKLPIAVLRFNAGSLNSRKAMVSPFLPKIPR